MSPNAASSSPSSSSSLHDIINFRPLTGHKYRMQISDPLLD